MGFRGGGVMGYSLCSFGVIVLWILLTIYKIYFEQADFNIMMDCVAGYGLGGSTVAMFGRVGGGIYTKAADVGADLAGKGADLFGSLAESTCAALIVSATSQSMVNTPEAIYFPLVVTAIGIGASFICQFLTYIKMENVNNQLKVQLWVSTVLMTVMIIPAIFMLPEEGIAITFAGVLYNASQWECYLCIILGLWSGLFIGLITEYYTSKENRPTQELAEACAHGAAPNIINGLALGYLSCVIPIFCLAVTVLVSLKYAAMYGISLAAIGMLGCLPIALSIDGYGPISDNAGGC